MPVYLYRCPQGHETEIHRPVEDANESAYCAECGAGAQRLHKLGGISFKGPGFYATDHGRTGASRRLRD